MGRKRPADRRVHPDVPTLREWEEAFGEKAPRWMGRCHEVACVVNKRLGLGLKECYGLYTGTVRKGYFNPGRLAYRHGWLELPDGRVVDPTRWVFEATKPYIHLSNEPCGCSDFVPDAHTDGMRCAFCGHVVEEHGTGFFRECQVGPVEYDLGGERFKASIGRGDQPPADQPDVLNRVDFTLTDPDAVAYVRGLFRSYPRLNLQQLLYLGNRGPQELGRLARPIYAKLVEVGQQATIPYDYRVAVLGGGKYR